VERAGEAGADEVDAGVVERARRGDEDAWRTLVGRHLGLVYAICRGYGLQNGAAAEVNQLVWLRLVEHLPRIRTPEAIGGWIAATARSQCLSPRRIADRNGYATADMGVALTHLGRGGPGTLPAHEGGRLASAFVRIGAQCQRLLRLAATQPRPSSEAISAAVDLAVCEVEPSCARCLDRLCRLVAADADVVLAELGRLIAGGDAVPESWWDAAWSAYAWLTLDAVPAERIYDSTTVRRVPVPLGGGGAPGGGATGGGFQEIRQIRFSARNDGVELAVDTNGDEVLLSGHLTSGRVVSVTARWPGGERTARTDESGGFRFHGLPVAPLCVQVDGEQPLKTGWILP
jgi:DNA-directed RNA polymerase specialized sigma24 family protein